MIHNVTLTLVCADAHTDENIPASLLWESDIFQS